jgi:hypothetical protein
MPVELATIVDTTEDDIGLKVSVATNLRAQIHAAGVQATQEVFEQQILPDAKANSPVGGKGDPHPGKNRDSIQVSFRDRIETGWISAWIYTESGYGWLIEHGTSHNRALTQTPIRKRKEQPVADRTSAQPYIYPAMLRFVQNIAERAREILESQ